MAQERSGTQERHGPIYIGCEKLGGVASPESIIRRHVKHGVAARHRGVQARRLRQVRYDAFPAETLKVPKICRFPMRKAQRVASLLQTTSDSRADHGIGDFPRPG